MGIGILVCGLNGCGKSTVGKALAHELGYHLDGTKPVEENIRMLTHQMQLD